MSDQELMRRYLLGMASPEERTDLESEYLSDASICDDLTEAENDLIDAYVRGRLSDRDRAAFEREYLTSPQRRARVEFAHALTDISNEPKSVPWVLESSFRQRLTLFLRQAGPKLQWGIAAGAVAIILAVAWLKVPTDHRLRASSPPPQGAAQQRPGPAVLPPNVQSPDNNKEGTEIARVDKGETGEYLVQLTPGISRSVGSAAQTLAVPPVFSWIRLRLILDNDDHTSYTAVVETAEGRVVQPFRGLKSRLLRGDRVVDLRISSQLIQAGDFVVRLSGIDKAGNEEEIDVYAFSFMKK
jgi:hypothetical protein